MEAVAVTLRLEEPHQTVVVPEAPEAEVMGQTEQSTLVGEAEVEPEPAVSAVTAEMVVQVLLFSVCRFRQLPHFLSA